MKKIEKTLLEEKETIIHIENYSKSVCVYTTDYKVYNRLIKKLGEPHKTYAPSNNIKANKDEYISGASWTFDYFKNREILKNIFSITNILPKNKLS